jgi:hypothetical protein
MQKFGRINQIRLQLWVPQGFATMAPLRGDRAFLKTTRNCFFVCSVVWVRNYPKIVLVSVKQMINTINRNLNHTLIKL